MKALIKIFLLAWVPFLMFWVAVHPEDGSPPFLTFTQVTVVSVLAALAVSAFFKLTLGRADPTAPTRYVPYQGPEVGDPGHLPVVPNRPNAPSAPSTSQPDGCLPVEPRHGD
jgi:hypothetical protein